MKTKMWLMAGLVCVLAACAAESKGEQWQVGENNGAPSNNALANNESENNESSNNGNNVDGELGENNMTTIPDDRPMPRGGLSEGDPCDVTLECAAGLECVDVSEFEGPSERACAAPECFCADPELTYCLDGECALHDVQCVLDGCLDDYACTENTCICEGPSCEGGCASDDHCDWDEMCVDGGCQDAHCENDGECPARYVCGGRHSDRLCTIAGTTPVGESCGRDSDCATGYCYLDGEVCVKPCQANSECGERECVAPDHFDLFVPYCRAAECGDCADDEFCNYDGTCGTNPCPDGKCTLGMDT